MIEESPKSVIIVFCNSKMRHVCDLNEVKNENNMKSHQKNGNRQQNPLVSYLSDAHPLTG